MSSLSRRFAEPDPRTVRRRRGDGEAPAFRLHGAGGGGEKSGERLHFLRPVARRVARRAVWRAARLGPHPAIRCAARRPPPCAARTGEGLDTEGAPVFRLNFQVASARCAFQADGSVARLGPHPANRCAARRPPPCAARTGEGLVAPGFALYFQVAPVAPCRAGSRRRRRLSDRRWRAARGSAACWAPPGRRRAAGRPRSCGRLRRMISRARGA